MDRAGVVVFDDGGDTNWRRIPIGRHVANGAELSCWTAAHRRGVAAASFGERPVIAQRRVRRMIRAAMSHSPHARR